MPTGFTAPLEEREVTLAEFARRCSYNFFYDRAISSDEFPEDHETDTYERKALARDEAELARVEAMTEAEHAAEMNLRVEESRTSYVKINEERRCTRDRYLKLLDEVLAWQVAPDDEWSVGLKKVMRDQLETCLEFLTPADLPAEPSMPGWRDEQVAWLRKNIARRRREVAETDAAIAKKNDWLRRIRLEFGETK